MNKNISTVSRLVAILATAIVASASVAFAHGEPERVLGVVVAVDAQSIVVEGSDGGRVHVSLGSETEFVNVDEPGRLSDLAAGVRVVVVVDRHGGDAIATRVRYATAGAVGTE